MTKLIRIAVWAFIVSILASGIVLVQRAFAQDDYKILSHEYNSIYQGFLRQKIYHLHLQKGMRVVLYLKEGSDVHGTYQSYSKYDDSIWIKEEDHWFQTAYGIEELQDVSLDARRPV